MRLFITPADVWLFRGGLPFGEDATITSEFPPTPETMQGALRALIAAQWAGDMSVAFQDERLTKLIGDRSSYGRFRLHGYSLGVCTEPDAPPDKKHVTRLFPLPAHLIAEKHDDGNATHHLYLPSHSPGEQLLYYPQGMRALNKQKDVTLNIVGGREVRWVDADNLGKLLQVIADNQSASTLGVTGCTDGDLFRREARPGIGMEREKRTTREGIFFQTEMIRPGNEANFQVGLVADIHLTPDTKTATCSDACEYKTGDLANLRLPNSGWMTIGGERRPATFEVVGDGEVPHTTRNNQPNARRTLLYFATPAYFNGGWRPADWSHKFGAPPVAAAIPRQQLIGGWQLTPGKAGGSAVQNAKLLRRCIPAGSVLFFDTPVSISGPYTDYGKEIGFGMTIQGVW